MEDYEMENNSGSDAKIEEEKLTISDITKSIEDNLRCRGDSESPEQDVGLAIDRYVSDEEDEEDIVSEAEEVSGRQIELEEMRARNRRLDESDSEDSEGEETATGVYDIVERELDAVEMSGPEGSEEEGGEEEGSSEGESVYSEEDPEDRDLRGYLSEEFWLASDGEVNDEYERRHDMKMLNHIKNAKERKAKGIKAEQRSFQEEEEGDDPLNGMLDDMAEEKKPRSKKGGKRRRSGIEESTDEEDDRVSEKLELKVEKDFPIDDKIMAMYKSYYIYYTMLVVDPDYKNYLTNSLKKLEEKQKSLTDRYMAVMKKLDEDAGDKHWQNRRDALKRELEQVSNAQEGLKIQVACEQDIKKVSEIIISCVYMWIMKVELHEQLTLASILVRPNKNEEIVYMSFRRVDNHTSTCAITNRAIKAGQAWCATMTRGDGRQETCLIDFHWVQFLSYWQSIFKHTEIIMFNAKRDLEPHRVNGKIPNDLLAAHINNIPQIASCLRLLMTCFAWFYRELDDTPEGASMLEKVDTNWYTVWSPQKKKKYQ